MATLARTLGRSPTTEQKTDLLNRRHRLQNRITEFQRVAQNMLPDDVDAENMVNEIDDPLWDDIEDTFADDEDVAGRPEVVDEEELVPPEKQGINLPSSLEGGESSGDFVSLQEKELELRIGQANDALQDIRLGVANRSILFRTTLRHATGYASGTRAHRQLHGLSAVVSKAARVYNLARKAMVRLGAEEEMLQKYRVLEKSHLRADTAAIDFNQPGNRNARLSWIWSVDEGQPGSNMMLDGASCYMYSGEQLLMSDVCSGTCKLPPSHDAS